MKAITSTKTITATENTSSVRISANNSNTAIAINSNTAMSGKRISYVRVSSVDQNDARQLEGVAVDKTFTDKASGKDVNRPQLTAMLEFVREGDHVIVHSMDRLSRSLRDLQDVVEKLTSRGITVTFVKENLTFAPPATGGDAHRLAYSTLMMQLLGAVGQFERSLIRERQREGIAIAKSLKKFKGRKPSLDSADVARLKALARDGVKKTDLANKFGISRASVYAYLGA
jgi:DNA invertase Pin-like site-specific DNA recombinase